MRDSFDIIFYLLSLTVFEGCKDVQIGICIDDCAFHDFLIISKNRYEITEVLCILMDFLNTVSDPLNKLSHKDFNKSLNLLLLFLLLHLSKSILQLFPLNNTKLKIQYGQDIKVWKTHYNILEILFTLQEVNNKPVNTPFNSDDSRDGFDKFQQQVFERFIRQGNIFKVNSSLSLLLS